MRRWSHIVWVLLVPVLMASRCRSADDTGADDTADTGDELKPVHDPLSMPATATLDPSEFSSSTSCAPCHPTHVEQWSGSAHAYATIDPVWRALVEIRQTDLDGTQDQFCTSCHSAIATRGGEIDAHFDWSDLSPISLEGVTCEACHKVSSLERDHNSGHRLDPTGPMRGPIQDPAMATHESVYDPLFESSEFCGGCHDVIETTGLELERPYQEWLASPAAEEGEPCQTCHMPASTGPAVTGGADRTVHDHSWIGVDVPLTEGFVTPEELERRQQGSEDLLTGSGTLLLTAPESVDRGEQLDVVVTVRNEMDSHNLPTGTTFIRQMWVELVARDETGAVVYETGTLDDNGDLRNHWSEVEPYGDADLLAFHSGFVDAAGAPTLFPWRATEHFANSIPALQERTFTLFVPTRNAPAGSIHIAARLRFRSHPPYLLRALALDDYLDGVQVIDIDAMNLEVPMDEP